MGSNKIRPLSAGGRELFSTLLPNIQVITTNDNPSDTYEAYFKKALESYNVAFSIMNRSDKQKQPSPWITYRLKQCIKKKAKLYRLFLKGRISRVDYTTDKNRLTNVLHRSKILYFTKLFMERVGNSKLLWSCINDILNTRNNQTIPEAVVNGAVLSGEALTNHVNNYFINIASSITKGLPQQPMYVCLGIPVRESCFFYPINLMEIMNILAGLKNRGSKLLDIHPSILKENSIWFSSHLVELYNFSLVKSIFPSVLKIAQVTPGHKSGTVDKVDNYRPISVLPLFSKIFEKLIFNRMNGFIEKHNILTTCQFGFCKGRSTTQAIVKLLSQVVQAYHKKMYSACFFLDLRKAFNTINHTLLL